MLGNDDLGGMDLNEINDMVAEQTPPCSLYEPIDAAKEPDCCNCNNGTFGQHPENC